jgi:hypothetical protein
MRKVDLSTEVFIQQSKRLLESRSICLDADTNDIEILVDIANFGRRWLVLTFVNDETDDYSMNYGTNDDDNIIVIFKNLALQLMVADSVGYEIDFAVMSDRSVISIDFNVKMDNVGNKIIILQIIQRSGINTEEQTKKMQEDLKTPSREDN